MLKRLGVIATTIHCYRSLSGSGMWCGVPCQLFESGRSGRSCHKSGPIVDGRRVAQAQLPLSLIALSPSCCRLAGRCHRGVPAAAHGRGQNPPPAGPRRQIHRSQPRHDLHSLAEIMFPIFECRPLASASSPHPLACQSNHERLKSLCAQCHGDHQHAARGPSNFRRTAAHPKP